MKKEYVKPEVEILDFSIKEHLMSGEDDIIDGELTNSGEFDF